MRWSWHLHRTTDGRDVPVALFLPPRYGPGTRLVVVLHGRLRNAAEYIEAWIDWAAAHDRVVACPRFDEDQWPGSRGYNLGNLFTRDDGRGRLNPASAWAFTAVEEIARSVATQLNLRPRRFDLWGHSAGAQVVHRFALFRPAAPVRWLIAAGAGWYTLPDPTLPFPYGTRHSRLGLGASDLRRWTRGPLTIMRGADDTVRDEHLRTTDLADRQGPTRWDRAAAMLRAARAIDRRTGWRLVDVPRTAHDHQAMARAAQRLLEMDDDGRGVNASSRADE